MLYLMLNSKEREKKNMLKLQKENERRTLEIQLSEQTSAEEQDSPIKNDARFKIMYSIEMKTVREFRSTLDIVIFLA